MAINGINPTNTTYNPYLANAPAPSMSIKNFQESIKPDHVELGVHAAFAGGIEAKNALHALDAARKNVGVIEKAKIGTGSVMRSGWISAAISGVISAARNIYDFSQGRISGTRAAGNVSADVVGGLGGGLVAAGAATLATSVIAGSAFTVGLVGFAAGTAAFIGADMLYRGTGLYQGISDFATDAFGRVKSFFTGG